jgi:phospholipid-binding lipoprotein MlaA
MRSTILALLALAALASGCATTEPTRDPWEGFNRKTFAFNEKLDQAVLKPVAQGYVKVVPGFAREGVSNFYANLEDVGTSLNNILQGKPREGLSDAGRFLVNTIFGVFGLWDVATPLGLEKHYEDFGQTLGKWGMHSGPYLVLPFMGPSTLRDTAAKPVDPSWYYSEAFDPERWYWAFWTLDKVQLRASLLQSEKVLDEAALDRYTFVRDAWVQRRRHQVFDGNAPRLKEED